MPTATSAFAYTISNLGPLTETFTVAPSCATLTDKVQVALATLPEANQFVPECTAWTYSDCYPSGSAIDAAFASNDIENPLAGYTLRYFSPGLVCPTGWTTAGVATKSKDGSITSSGPAFVLPTTESLGSLAHIYQNPLPNVLLGVMDQEETAVLCCPSSMSADLFGQCKSVMPSYHVSSGCMRWVPTPDYLITTTALSVFGTTVTAEIISYTQTFPITETSSTTVPASSASDYVGVSVMPAVMLVHKESDLEATKTASESGSTSAATANNESGTPSTSPNAAASLRTAWKDSALGLSFLWCIVVMALGSTMMLIM